MTTHAARTCSASIPIRGLKTLNLQYPESITNLMPSTVRLVSAMFVAITHLRLPSGAGSKMSACRSPGNSE